MQIQQSKIDKNQMMASIMAIIMMMIMVTMATPIQDNNVVGGGSGGGGSSGEDMIVPLDSNSLKSILLYNRLQQLIENEPEMLDLFDMDHNHLTRIIDELLAKSSQIRVRKFLNVKSNKRAAAMGVDLPDYILHINKGKNFDFSSFREKMQKSG
ncbi:uncharacterized protein LOC113788785 [Dermatophagoides pteronyssinus]|uniref:Uncharacterized protein n=1 Tax=Dermatophagoides pteronyssinus TaxID=6956 RepID=A0ABQ8JUS5_DERPT|nr:hypothetical protein DERP_010874 [Dermatophagoides pteronyssinus]